MKIFKATLILLLIIGKAQASPVIVSQKYWSLKQCIAYGLEHNPNARIARNQLATAKEQKRQALSYYLPQVNGSASLDDNLKRQVSVIPAGVFGPTATEVQFGTKYTSLLNAQLSQTVFDYAILIGLKANKVNRQLADLTYQQSQEQIAYAIAQSYYQVLLSQRQKGILLDNLNLYNRLYRILKVQADKGVVAKIEVDKVSVNRNNIEARIANVENITAQAFNNLQFQMGLTEIQEQMVLTDSVVTSYDLPEALAMPAFDYTTHTNYKLQQAAITFNEFDAKRIRAMGYPRLSIVGNYGAQALNDNFSDLYNRLYDFSAIGLRLSVPIFDGFTRNSQWKQKKIDIQNQKLRLELTEAQSKLQYENANIQINQNRLSLETNQRNIELATKVFNTTNLQYEKGVVPLSELLQAEQSLREAQNTYITTMVNYYQALLDFENANSNILDYYNQLN